MSDILFSTSIRKAPTDDNHNDPGCRLLTGKTNAVFIIIIHVMFVNIMCNYCGCYTVHASSVAYCIYCRCIDCTIRESIKSDL